MNFLDYALSLNPSVLSMPIAGHLETYDGYGRAVTVNGTPSWQNSRQGFGFKPVNATDLYYVADGVEQDFTDQTIFTYYLEPLNSSSLDQEPNAKWNATGITWLTRISAATGFINIFNSAAAVRTSTTSVVGCRSHTIATTGSTSVNFFIDGILVDSLGGLDFGTQYDTPIYIGNRYSGSRLSASPIAVVAIFPLALTNTQIGLLHAYAEQIVVGYQPKQIKYYPSVDTKGAVIHLAGSPNSTNIIPDLSGNGNDGNVGGELGIVNRNEGVLYNYLGGAAEDSRIDITSNASIDNIPAQTFQWVFNKKGDGAASAGRPFNKTQYYIYTETTFLSVRQNFSVANGIWRFSYPDNLPAFTQLTYDKSSDSNFPSCYLNGNSVSAGTVSSPSGTYTADNGNDLNIGNFSSGIRAVDGDMSNIKYFPSVLSADDLRSEYLDYALKNVIRHTPRFEHSVTLSGVSAPGYVGPWFNSVGTHDWVDDGIKRGIELQTSGDLASIESNSAYGAWYSLIEKDGSGAWHSWMFLSSVPDENYLGANQVGYMTLISATGEFQLYEMNGGGVTKHTEQTAGYIPSTGTIEQFITRRVTDGQFNVYVRDSSHTTWTLALTHTDNTHTTSNNQLVYMSSGSGDVRCYNFLSWPYGDSLTPNDIPEIAD